MPFVPLDQVCEIRARDVNGRAVPQPVVPRSSVAWRSQPVARKPVEAVETQAAVARNSLGMPADTTQVAGPG